MVCLLTTVVRLPGGRFFRPGATILGETVMNFCFLSPHFPPNYVHFASHLNRLGAKVYGVADASWDSLDVRLKESLTEYYRVEDMEDYDQLVRAVGYITFKAGKVDRLESFNEYWLETEAALRTDFNIFGIRRDSIERVKRKSVMKAVFQKAGVKVAPGVLVESLAGCRDFIDQVGYPVIVKPDIGVGAAKTYKIHDDEALAAFFADKPDATYFMEKFVSGQIVSYDGLTDAGGQVVFCASHVFSQGIMETVNDDRDIYYYSLRELPADLVAAGEKLVKAFDIKERFFHIEFFRTPLQELVALEVNMRPPGGLTTDMFNYANDIDIYREYANVVVKGRFETAVTRPWHCAYVGQKFSKRYRHNHAEILHALGAHVVHHQPISGAFASALGNYGFLVRAADVDQILQMAAFIQEKE